MPSLFSSQTLGPTTSAAMPPALPAAPIPSAVATSSSTGTRKRSGFSLFSRPRPATQISTSTISAPLFVSGPASLGHSAEASSASNPAPAHASVTPVIEAPPGAMNTSYPAPVTDHDPTVSPRTRLQNAKKQWSAYLAGQPLSPIQVAEWVAPLRANVVTSSSTKGDGNAEEHLADSSADPGPAEPRPQSTFLLPSAPSHGSLDASGSMGGISASTSRNTVMPASHPIMSTSLSGRSLGVGPREGTGLTPSSSFLQPSGSQGALDSSSPGQKRGLTTLGSAIRLGSPGSGLFAAASPARDAKRDATVRTTSQGGSPAQQAARESLNRVLDRAMESDGLSPPPESRRLDTTDHEAGGAALAPAPGLPRSTSGNSIFNSYRTRRGSTAAAVAAADTPSAGGGESLGRRISRRLSIDGLRPIFGGSKRRAGIESGRSVSVTVKMTDTSGRDRAQRESSLPAVDQPVDAKPLNATKDKADKIALPGMRTWRSRFKSASAVPTSGASRKSTWGLGSSGAVGLSTSTEGDRNSAAGGRKRDSWIDIGPVRSNASFLSANSGSRARGPSAAGIRATDSATSPSTSLISKGRVVGSGSELENLHRRSQLFEPKDPARLVSHIPLNDTAVSQRSLCAERAQIVGADADSNEDLCDLPQRQVDTPGARGHGYGLASQSVASLHAPTVYSVAGTSRLSPAMDDKSLLDPSQSRRASPEPPVPQLPAAYRGGSLASMGGMSATVSSRSLNTLDRESMAREMSRKLELARQQQQEQADKAGPGALDTPFATAAEGVVAVPGSGTSRVHPSGKDSKDDVEHDESRPVSLVTPSEAQVLIATRARLDSVGTATDHTTAEASGVVPPPAPGLDLPREDSTRTFHTARSEGSIRLSPQIEPSVSARAATSDSAAAPATTVAATTTSLAAPPNATVTTPIRARRTAQPYRDVLPTRRPASMAPPLEGTSGVSAEPPIQPSRSLIERTEKEQGAGWWSLSRPAASRGPIPQMDEDEGPDTGTPTRRSGRRTTARNLLQEQLDDSPSASPAAARGVDSPRKSILRQPLRFGEGEKQRSIPRSASHRVLAPALARTEPVSKAGEGVTRDSPLRGAGPAPKIGLPSAPSFSLTLDSPSARQLGLSASTSIGSVVGAGAGVALTPGSGPGLGELGSAFPSSNSIPGLPSALSSHSIAIPASSAGAITLSLAPAATLISRDATIKALRDKHELELDAVLDALRSAKRDKERLVRELARAQGRIQIAELKAFGAEDEVENVKRKLWQRERKNFTSRRRVEQLEKDLRRVRVQLEDCEACRAVVKLETADEEDVRRLEQEKEDLQVLFHACAMASGKAPLPTNEEFQSFITTPVPTMSTAEFLEAQKRVLPYSRPFPDRRPPSAIKGRDGASPGHATQAQAQAQVPAQGHTQAQASASTSAQTRPPSRITKPGQSAKVPVASGLTSPCLPSMPSSDLLLKTTPLPEISDDDLRATYRPTGQVLPSASQRHDTMPLPVPGRKDSHSGSETLAESDSDAPARGMGMGMGKGKGKGRGDAVRKGLGLPRGRSGKDVHGVDEFGRLSTVSDVSAAPSEGECGLDGKGQGDVSMGETSFESSDKGSAWELRLRAEDERHLATMR